MKIRFLLGRAGSGKTHRCLQEMGQTLRGKPSGPPLILIVPEQATYQMDRALLEVTGVGATSRACVLAFKQLAHRLLSVHGGLTRRFLNGLGRNMLVRALLRQLGDRLTFYRAESLKPGLVASLDQMLHELRLYDVKPEQIETAANGFIEDPFLASKLADLHLLYATYCDRFASEGLMDEADLAQGLCQAVDASPWLLGARVWVDSFSDFTQLEYNILRAVVAKVEEATFTLALDPAKLGTVAAPGHDVDPAWLFARSEETYRRLRGLAAPGRPVEVVSLPESGALPRFGNAEMLHLESSVFPDARPAISTTAPCHVVLVEAANRRAEVEACAREIQRLARECGYRYRDVAVVVRDLAGYEDYFQACFRDRQIPFFIDRRQSVAHHALIELIRSILRVCLEGWKHDTVLPYLRSGLVPIHAQIVDELDNLALEHGIEGESWYRERPWASRPPRVDDEPVEAAAVEASFDGQRRAAFLPLRNTQKRLADSCDDKGRATVRELATILFEHLDGLGAAARLAAWRLQAEKAGRLDLASEHTQVWDGMIGLLDELVTALGSDRLTLQEFADVLESGLASLTLGLIPPSLDEVLVGSIDRSRQPAIKASFLLGLSEGTFPLVGAENPILDDRDREHLQKQQIELAPSSKERFYQEYYLGYIALTRASERVWLSYPAADEKGRKINPSPFVERVRVAFPRMAPKVVGLLAATTNLADIDHTLDLASAIANLRWLQPSSAWIGLYNRALGHPVSKKCLERVLPGWTYSNQAKLSPGLAKALYGASLQATVSRLEAQAWCPFKHFAQYGLRLKPRQEFRLEAFDLGNLAHDVLRSFTEQTQDEAWADLDLTRAHRIVEDEVERLSLRIRNEIMMATARNRYIQHQLARMLKSFVRVLREHAQVTEFLPVAAEVSFGFDQGLSGLTFDLSGGAKLQVRGRIDRIDLAQAGDRKHVRVIDYKSTKKTLRLDALYHGLALQLITYLLVASEAHQAEPTGAFFSALSREISKKKSAIEEVTAEEFRKEYKLRGLFNREHLALLEKNPPQQWSSYYSYYIKSSGDFGMAHVSDEVSPTDLVHILDKVKGHLIRLANEILSGEISVRPVEHRGELACRHCDFQAVCRREPIFNPANVLEAKKRTEALAELSARES